MAGVCVRGGGGGGGSGGDGGARQKLIYSLSFQNNSDNLSL